MQNLESLKNKTQESISSLIERGKAQPEEVKTWGVTAAAGLGGAMAVVAVAKGVAAVVATLANPPVAFTVGALGGGALGWSWMQKQGQEVIVEQSTGEEARTVTEATTEATDAENNEDRA